MSDKFFLKFALASNFSIIIYLILYFIFPNASLILEFLSPKENRELGFIESLQNVILLLCLFRIAGFIKNFNTLYAFKYLFLFLFFLFIFMEEVDYLTNYLEVIFGVKSYSFNLSGFRNLHNQASFTVIRKSAYWILAFLTLLFFLKEIKGKKDFLIFNGLLFISIQIVLTIFYAVTFGAEDYRQIISETLELNLFISWLYLIPKVEYKIQATVITKKE
jgi:hypothetical protein